MLNFYLLSTFTFLNSDLVSQSLKQSERLYCSLEIHLMTCNFGSCLFYSCNQRPYFRSICYALNFLKPPTQLWQGQRSYCCSDHVLTRGISNTSWQLKQWDSRAHFSIGILGICQRIVFSTRLWTFLDSSLFLLWSWCSCDSENFPWDTSFLYDNRDSLGPLRYLSYRNLRSWNV